MPTPKYYKEEFYPTQKSKIVDQESLEKWIAWADDKHSEDDTDTRFRVSYTYLATAEYLADQFEQDRDLERISRLFHFAGHHFRKVENWSNSALAYERAGDIAMQHLDYEWAVRSYGRAKQSQIDVGDAEYAALLYIKEQDARRQAAKPSGNLFTYGTLSLWRLTSKYGQSWPRWIASMFGFLVVFAFAYEYTHVVRAIDFGISQWIPIVSGFYVAIQVVTTLGISNGMDSDFCVQTFVILNVILGWLLLGIGAGIVARRVKER
jgi:hypothetical protein